MELYGELSLSYPCYPFLSGELISLYDKYKEKIYNGNFKTRYSQLVLLVIYCFIVNTELNDMRKAICLRKCEVSVERISVCNVIGNLAEHGIHCLPCSCTNDVIDVLP